MTPPLFRPRPAKHPARARVWSPRIPWRCVISRSYQQVFLWPPGTPGTGLARAPAYGVQEVQVERPCGSKALLRCTRCSQASRDQCHTCRCMPIAPRHTRRSSIPVTRNSPQLELPHRSSRARWSGAGDGNHNVNVPRAAAVIGDTHCECELVAVGGAFSQP